MITQYRAGTRRGPTGPVNVEANSRRLSRWMSILYVATALATPLFLYFGPDVLSPTAPAIANAALDGHFTMHPDVACNAKTGANVRSATNDHCQGS